MKDFDEKFVLSKLAIARKEAGFTQSEVENLLNLRRGSIYDWESGRLEISVANCWLLLKTYEKDWSLFLAPTDDQTISVNPGITPLAEIGLLATRAAPAIQSMYNDPRIIEEIGDSGPARAPLLENLLENMTEVQKRDFVLELNRYVNATITIDQKITAEERNFAELLIKHSRLELNDREKNSLRRCLGKEYYGGSVEKKLPRLTLRHFLIWVLFLVAICDNDLNYLETEYIEKVARHIQLPHDWYMDILSRVREVAGEKL